MTLRFGYYRLREEGPVGGVCARFPIGFWNEGMLKTRALGRRHSRIAHVSWRLALYTQFSREQIKGVLTMGYTVLTELASKTRVMASNMMYPSSYVEECNLVSVRRGHNEGMPPKAVRSIETFTSGRRV